METDRNTHSRIAEGLKAGDNQAWLMLYDSYAAKLLQNVGWLMPNDPAAVADIVQETFLAAARSARTYDAQRASLWVWLWTIAKRQIALYYRKLKSANRMRQALEWWITLDGEKQHMIRHMETPAQLLEVKELAVLVRHCLSQLPAEYQVVLLEKYVDDVPVEQIAEHMKRSAVAVRSTLARARKAFRRVFVKATTRDPAIREVIK
jgi:RNA polymerase sigma-70 factor, ECF subfamily